MNEPRDPGSFAEAGQLLRSLHARVEQLERDVADHAQRFDTLQTVPWKRFWFWLQGWPWWADLNAPRRRWRPWNRGD